MTEYDFQRSKRRCSLTDRIFEPGEYYVSALIEVGEGFERRDFSLDEWKKNPIESVGWWKCQVPEKVSGKVYWAPRGVLMRYFTSIYERWPDAAILFVLGIALVRRKVLRMTANEVDEAGIEWMVLESTNSQQQFRIQQRVLSNEQIQEIQAELNEHLFTDSKIDEEEPDEDN
ncbi:MAG TPA: hypothetical protein PKD64_11940 [Pirellulaceae bacterium]|nr:hypothetical protein [Pirellulaceae bacterium]HMO92896.1 hypothetical protein [Pirellulaceae bacterium]HMP69174.1 hypothetical protein [Pirellulaceae bacterium]